MGVGRWEVGMRGDGVVGGGVVKNNVPVQNLFYPITLWMKAQTISICCQNSFRT